MLSVILFILKLIGMILAFIVGFVFLVLLLVLLVPIRYRVYFTYEEKLYGEVKIHWLLHIIHFYSSYIDDKLSMRIRILGKIIYDSNKEKKPRGKKKEKDTKREKGKKTAREKNIADISGENKKQEDITDTSLLEKPKIQPQEDSIKQSEAQIEKNRAENLNKQLAEEEHLTSQIEKSKETRNQKEQSNEPEEQQKEEVLTEQQEEKQEEKPQKESQQEIKQEIKQTVWDKIKNIIKKIREVICSIIGLPAKVKEFITSLFNKIKKQTSRIKEIINKIKLFMKDEVNKDSFFHIMKSVVQVLKHLNPRKLSVKVEFGLEDPAATGMLLGGLSALIGFHGKFVRLIPNFNEEVLKGEILAIGRVRIIRLLIIGIRLILYKNNRQLIKNLKTLKEEL